MLIADAPATHIVDRRITKNSLHRPEESTRESSGVAQPSAIRMTGLTDLLEKGRRKNIKAVHGRDI
jgi:hypothetical protein